MILGYAAVVTGILIGELWKHGRDGRVLSLALAAVYLALAWGELT